MSERRKFWSPQRILQIISFVILVFVAFTLAGLPIGVLTEGPSSIETVLIGAASAIPPVIVFVTAYRQLFRQRSFLVGLSFALTMLFAIGLWACFVMFRSLIEDARAFFSQMFDPETAELLIPAFSHMDFITFIIFYGLLFLIPLYTNFRKIPA